MSNNRNRIVFPAEYGRLQPQLAPAVQGGEAIYTLYLLRQDGTVYPIPAGATLEIVYQDTSDDETYSTTSGLTATDEDAGIVTWEAAAALGLAGTFWLSLKVNDDVSLRVKWKVEAALDASGAVPPVALTSLTAAQALLVGGIEVLTGLVEMAAGSASGVAIQAFMQSFLGTANVIAARLNLLPSYTGNTGKVLAVNGTETDVEWVAQSGGGVAWGDITGDPADQEDIALILDGKQNIDADLTTIAGLTPSNDDIIQRKAGAWAVRTVAQYVTDILAGWAAHITTFLQSASAADARSAIEAGDTNEYIVIALSDETTALTTGTAKATFVMPYAMTLTGVVATVNTAPTGSAIQVDINEGVSSILSTKLTIDAVEKTSATTATPAVISDTALASGAEIILDIDAVGSTVAGSGLKVTLIGTRA